MNPWTFFKSLLGVLWCTFRYLLWQLKYAADTVLQWIDQFKWYGCNENVSGGRRIITGWGLIMVGGWLEVNDWVGAESKIGTCIGGK